MRRLAWLAALALVVGGCATAATTPEGQTGAAASGRPPAGAARPPAPPTARQELAAKARGEAERLEREGELRRALDQWKIALLIDPKDQVARDGQTRLEGRIEQGVTQRINEGRAALQRGSHVEARRRFLAALAMDPFNKTAFDALQNDVREVEFLSHTVRAGETLASIAQRYYGDRSRSEVIWETNQLPPNPRLVAGTTLKIPEIPGVPFARVEPPRRDPLPPVAGVPPSGGSTAPPPTPGSAPSRSESVRDESAPPEVNPLLADAREALDRNEYSVALAGLDRLLSSTPSDREGQDLRKVALYRYGKSQLDQKQYEESYRTLTQLAKVQPNYEDSGKLLQQARARVIDKHYSEGIKLYRDEKLKEAIREWQVVLEFDPSHANAKKNIEQAERLLKGLEQRKKK
ncbi:MAG TPA: LysM peptidoglycan-binding domain-containing protein [Verrucomicrobiae bacterium]|nr:LysM peptidoglycan-binding domain-containing protein [Verrucomicrobiae bacterium]